MSQVLEPIRSFCFVSSSKKLIKRVISGISRESCYFGLFWDILGYFGLFWVILGYFRSFRVKFIKNPYSGYIRKSCYFGLFWLILGSIRVSIGGFVKRVISGYSRESCYLGHFRSF